MAESREELKSHLMKVKEESENASLKLNIQKTKIMASGPITSWEIDGETVETVTDCTFFSSQISEDSDCSHEIKRHLLLGRKAMSNLDIILKSKDVTRCSSSQSYYFSSCHVWLWELDHKEGWVPKNWCFWTHVEEDFWESFGQQGDQTSQSNLNIPWKDWCWNWNSNTLATWSKDPSL